MTITTRGIAYIQFLALVTMTIDHLGYLSILGEWSRIVGRFAMPAFVVMVAINAAVAVRPDRQLVRLVLLAVLSQPLWIMALGWRPMLCIMATLLAVAALVQLWQTQAYLPFGMVLSAFLTISPWIEYGPWPLLLVPFAVRPGLLTFALALVWPVVQYLHEPHFQIPALVVLLALVMLLRFPVDVPRLPRLVTRWFYPAHLVVLAFLV